MNQELLNEINAAYDQLEMKKAEIIHALSPSMFELGSGWYNGHFHKSETGEWQKEAYPIPVISVRDLCDIEIQFHEISISTKLKRTAALAYSFEKFSQYEFEAYGGEDYLADFYHQGQTIQELKEKIFFCNETEIGFSFVFPFESEEKQIFEFVNLLRQEGFYY